MSGTFYQPAIDRSDDSRAYVEMPGEIAAWVDIHCRDCDARFARFAIPPGGGRLGVVLFGAEGVSGPVGPAWTYRNESIDWHLDCARCRHQRAIPGAKIVLLLRAVLDGTLESRRVAM